ncbi:hypothetical protein M0P65_07740 [Candidatus Gracilibacteria bacterium]|jgi:hypothetical protein|nr:hypothetical protein [Candidatus Gracilibacteria bacterium]
MNTYLFVREEGFYPLELFSDNEAIENALCNPGTKEVKKLDAENIITIWKEDIIKQ